MPDEVDKNKPPEKDFKEALTEELASRVPLIRSRRAASIEETWRFNHSAWRGRHERSFFKSETFNHFIPSARRAIERFAVRGGQMLIPSAHYFEVFPISDVDDDADERGKAAESVQAYMLFLMRKKIKAYKIVKQLMRTYLLYGRSILKVGVKVEHTSDGRSVFPSARVIDPWSWYIWPETVNDVEDASIIFEDSLMAWEKYQAMAERGLVDKVDRDKLVDPDVAANIIDRLSKAGISTPLLVGTSETKEGAEAPPKKEIKNLPGTMLHITEVWLKQPKGWKFYWLLWNIEGGPKMVRESKSTFSRPEYRVSFAREIPGENYTTSVMDDLEPLQVLLNDQVNMTLEGQAINFSPPTVIDLDRVRRVSSLVFRPRAKWFADPAGIKFMETHDTTKSGLTSINMTQGMIDQFSGSSKLADGETVRNLPRAGFAVANLINLSLADIRDVAQALEDDILSPMLGDMFAITTQLIPKDQIFKIPGTRDFPSIRITPGDMGGDFEFYWVGSIQSQDLQERSQRLLTIAELLGKFSEKIEPQLQREGKKIDWATLITRLWREGAGERGTSTLITDLTDDEKEQILIEQITALQKTAEAEAQQNKSFDEAEDLEQ